MFSFVTTHIRNICPKPLQIIKTLKTYIILYNIITNITNCLLNKEASKVLISCINLYFSVQVQIVSKASYNKNEFLFKITFYFSICLCYPPYVGPFHADHVYLNKVKYF